VAFFLFVLGFSLAREKRPARQVLFNRLFDIYLFGFTFALLMSPAAYVQTGRLAASNYLPFLLGSNVVFDNFPSNPTTWFIGTYLHALLLWALVLRNRRIRPWVLVVAGTLEVILRAGLIESQRLFVAYMVLPNWASVFLLGLYYGQQPKPDRPPGRAAALNYLSAFGLLVVAWPALWESQVTERSFPFMRLTAWPSFAAAAVTSVAVTALYVTATWLVYQVTRRLPDFGAVRFLARNTLIVFIAHMPLYYLIVPSVSAWATNYWARVGARLLICLVLLALVSEFVYWVIQPRILRDRLWLLCQRGAGGSRTGISSARKRGVPNPAEMRS
jgi:hypothetical protein